MSRIFLGLIAGTVLGALDIGLMLPMSFPDKTTALLGAFASRFAIGFVIGCVQLPGWPGWLVALVGWSAHAQSTESAASPEMARLAQAPAGDWNTVEILQQGKPVPEGAGRKGEVYVRLTGGGTVLASEGHSVGTIGGDLRWFITIWWDKEATCYRLLACFRTKTSAGCELRG